MPLTIILFLLGFVLLIKGADFLVEGSSLIAKKYGISSIVIGLTIMAFGTSAPELIVSTLAAWKGSASIALGNVIGSNIANILLILGVSSLVAPLVVKKNTTFKEIPFSFLAAVALAILVNDQIFNGGSLDILSRADGLILILFFIIFFYYVFGIARSKESKIDNLKEAVGLKIKKTSFFVNILMIFGGLIGLALGGKLIVDGAIEFARVFGLSESLIGLTIVAVGTSLPELASSVVAAKKGEADLAVGNIIGSNIFNILWILSVSALIRPLPFAGNMNIDILLLLAVSLVLIVMVFAGKKNVLWRWEGGIMLTLYASYVAFLIIRG